MKKETLAFFKASNDLGNNSSLDHILRTVSATSLFFTLSYVYKGIRCIHFSFKETPIIAHFSDNWGINKLLLVEFFIWEQADGWMHPILSIKKMLLVSQRYQPLKQTSSISSLFSNL